MHFFVLVFTLIFSAAVSAGPIWNYELRGEVHELVDPIEYGDKIDVGDEFRLSISIRSLGAGGGLLDVNGNGYMGSQSLPLFNDIYSEYVFFDGSPERFLTVGWSEGLGKYLELHLFGLDETGDVFLPESERLVKENGQLNSARFLKGRLIVNSEDGKIVEGRILSITQVPEADSLMLVVAGLFVLITYYLSRRTVFRCKQPQWL